MRNLIEFLKNYHHWFLFILLEVASVVMLLRYNSYQGSVWFSSANAVAGKMHEVNASIDSYFKLSQINSQLTERNLQLEQELRAVKEQLLDSQQLAEQNDTSVQTMRHRAVLSAFHLIPAKVIDNSVARHDNLLTIDKGKADGVKVDMGVASGTGLVGIVYMTSAHYSVVIPLINTYSSISCSIDGRGYFGYLRWDGRQSNVAYLEDVPRHARFRRGDRVVTSGYSSVFPPGIQVGRIGTVYNSADGLSYKVKVHLSTNFSKLRDVCVIDDNTSAERLQLLRLAQDSIKPTDDK